VRSYLVDDGWDDPDRGLWAENTSKFPGGFAALKTPMARLDAHLAIWISPMGGYGGEAERIGGKHPGTAEVRRGGGGGAYAGDRFCRREPLCIGVRAGFARGYPHRRRYAAVAGGGSGILFREEYFIMQFDIHKIETTTSTNDELGIAAASGAAEGYVVWALRQSSGRVRSIRPRAV